MQAVIRLQAIARGRIGRKRTNQVLVLTRERHAAATCVQSSARRLLAARTAISLREAKAKRKHGLLVAAATKIQSSNRARQRQIAAVLRKELILQNNAMRMQHARSKQWLVRSSPSAISKSSVACVRLQAAARGQSDRLLAKAEARILRARRVREAIERESAERAAEVRARNLGIAAAKRAASKIVQAHARGLLARLEARVRRERKAAAERTQSEVHLRDELRTELFTLRAVVRSRAACDGTVASSQTASSPSKTDDRARR